MRIPLLWLVLLALPLQGFAHVEMRRCSSMPMPHSASSAAKGFHAGAEGQPSAAGKSAHSSAAPCDDVTAAKGHAKSCDTMTACGMSALPAPAVALVMQPAGSASPLQQPSLRPAAFFTDAPERPPRAD